MAWTRRENSQGRLSVSLNWKIRKKRKEKKNNAKKHALQVCADLFVTFSREVRTGARQCIFTGFSPPLPLPCVSFWISLVWMYFSVSLSLSLSHPPCVFQYLFLSLSLCLSEALCFCLFLSLCEWVYYKVFKCISDWHRTSDRLALASKVLRLQVWTVYTTRPDITMN